MKLWPLKTKRSANGAGAHNGAEASYSSAEEAQYYASHQGWLVADNVQKSYKKRMVVRGVSLAVGRGESVGLLGPNGAGKTTVFYMITGLVPADAGRITIDGRDVTPLPADLGHLGSARGDAGARCWRGGLARLWLGPD